MDIVYADYNIHYNSIDIAAYAGYILRIDCDKAEEGLKTTPNSECTLTLDNPLEYARLNGKNKLKHWYKYCGTCR